MVNRNEFKSIGAHWIALYLISNIGNGSSNAVYFDSFGIEHIPKEISKIIGNKKIITYIYRIQAYNSIT